MSLKSPLGKVLVKESGDNFDSWGYPFCFQGHPDIGGIVACARQNGLSLLDSNFAKDNLIGRVANRKTCTSFLKPPTPVFANFA